MSNLNGMSVRLREAIDVETAYRAYVKLQSEYNSKYGVRVSHPDDEVKKVKDIVNGHDDIDIPDWLTGKKKVNKTEKTSATTSSDSDLLL